MPMRPPTRRAALALLLSLAGVGLAQAAVTTGPLQGDTAAQAPLDQTFGRFDTDVIDAGLWAQLPAAAALSSNLRATGATVGVSFVGTNAAREALLYLAAAGTVNPGALVAPVVEGVNLLIDTRSGCSYAAALADPDCLIDSVGRGRTIGGLSAGSEIVLGLKALAQPLPPASEQRAADEYFFSGAAAYNGGLVRAHWLALDSSHLLIGFEEGQDNSYNDLVFLVSGAQVGPVPEPGTLALTAAGLGLLALCRWRRRPRTGG